MLAALAFSLVLQGTTPALDISEIMEVCGTDGECLRRHFAANRRANIDIDLEECAQDASCLMDLLRDPQIMMPADSWAGIVGDIQNRFPHLKDEILQLAFSEEANVQMKASHALQYWPDLTNDDLLLVLDAYEHAPLSPLALVLARFDEAHVRRRILEAFEEYGATGSIGPAIGEFGESILPELNSVMHAVADHTGNSMTHAGVYSVLRGEARRLAAAYWFDIASDATSSMPDRQNALTILIRLQDQLDAFRTRMDDLVAANLEADTRWTAFSFAAKYRVPDVLDDLVDLCIERRDVLIAEPEQFVSDLAYSWCLATLSRYGVMAQSSARHFVEMTGFPSGYVRATAIRFIGLVGATEFEDDVITALSDPDWRVVWSASVAAGELGLSDRLDALEEVETEHWYPDVREEARESRLALSSPPYRRLPPAVGDLGGPPDEFQLHGNLDEFDARCPAGPWQWQNQLISREDNQAISRREAFVLERGPWSASLRTDRVDVMGLYWSNNETGEERRLLAGFLNATAIDHQTLLVVKLGFRAFDRSSEIILLRHVHEGEWRTLNIGAVPGHVLQLGRVGSGLLALETSAGLIISDYRQILGLAECAED